jgi:hypothetical protein
LGITQTEKWENSHYQGLFEGRTFPFGAVQTEKGEVTLYKSTTDRKVGESHF